MVAALPKGWTGEEPVRPATYGDRKSGTVGRSRSGQAAPLLTLACPRYPPYNGLGTVRHGIRVRRPTPSAEGFFMRQPGVWYRESKRAPISPPSTVVSIASWPTSRSPPPTSGGPKGN